MLKRPKIHNEIIFLNITFSSSKDGKRTSIVQRLAQIFQLGLTPGLAQSDVFQDANNGNIPKQTLKSTAQSPESSFFYQQPTMAPESKVPLRIP